MQEIQTTSPPGADARTWRVLYRPRKGRGVRWRQVAAGLTHRDAVGLIVDGERGEYWLTDRPEQQEADGADDLP